MAVKTSRESDQQRPSSSHSLETRITLQSSLVPPEYASLLLAAVVATRRWISSVAFTNRARALNPFDDPSGVLLCFGRDVWVVQGILVAAGAQISDVA